jgi:uncharacterized protein YkwD
MFYSSLSIFIAHYFTIEKQWQYPLPFIILFLLGYIIVSSILFFVSRKIPSAIHERLPNKLSGIIPGVLTGIAIAFTIINLSRLSISVPVANNAKESFASSTIADSDIWVNTKLSAIFDGSSNMNISEAHQSIPMGEGDFKCNDFFARHDLENEMLDLLNEERKKHGLPLLISDEQMEAVAKIHGADMFVRGYFSHDTPEGADPFTRMRTNGVRFMHAGENLAHSYDLLSAHKGLMESPGHRANILNPKFGRVGISILDGESNGLMFVQEFRD